MVAVLAEQSLEVVAYRIGVAEAVTLGVNVADGRHTLISGSRHVLYIISRGTPEALSIFIVSVVTELSLQLQVLINLPAERTSQIQVAALLLLVVVVSRCDRVVETGLLQVVSTVDSLHGQRCVKHSIAQTAVGVVGTGSLVGTTTEDRGVGIACLEVQGGLLGRLRVQFQREVVTFEA